MRINIQKFLFLKNKFLFIIAWYIKTKVYQYLDVFFIERSFLI